MSAMIIKSATQSAGPIARLARSAPGVLFIWLATLLISLATLLGGCEEADDIVIEEKIRPVVTVVATPGSGTIQRAYSGVIQAGLTSRLSFRVAGIVDQVAVELGNKVKEGQLVASLSDTDFVLRLEKEQAALTQARAESKNASQQYERAKNLVEKGVISRTQYESEETTWRTSLSSVERAKKSVQLAKKQMAYTRLESPVADCSVSKLDVDVGENVAAGTQVAILSCGSTLEANIFVPENVIGRVHVGDDAEIVLNINRRKTYIGTVAEVGSASSARSTYPVIIRLSAPDPDIRPGMAADVTLSLNSDEDAGKFIVPFEAVGEDAEGRHVYIFEPMESDSAQSFGIAQRRQVEIGDVSYGGVSIARGINEGERIITAGLRYLNDGRQVKLLEWRAN